jgi:hypothetical protein
MERQLTSIPAAGCCTVHSAVMPLAETNTQNWVLDLAILPVHVHPSFQQQFQHSCDVILQSEQTQQTPYINTDVQELIPVDRVLALLATADCMNGMQCHL